MTAAINKKIGEVLELRRNILNRTQSDVGMQLGFGYKTISRREKGKLPSIEDVRLHCEALGLQYYEVETIANRAPVANFSQAARALNAAYWEQNR